MNFRQQLVSQFRQPSGMLGNIAGIVMANRPSNVARNHWTVDLLKLQPNDRVLELGFGPGIAIQYAAPMVTEGSITGIDHSETMLRQASKRNASSMREGRVELFLGSLENLPPYEKPFTKIFSANVIQFWEEPDKEIRKLRSMLATRGLLASTYMPRNRNASNEFGRAKAEEFEQLLRRAKFNLVEIFELSIQPLNAYCVVATNE